MALFETTEDVEEELLNYGEMMVVLESEREYALHTHDTHFYGEVVQTEGVPEDGGEYQIVQFPPEAVEHFYAHREN